MLMPASGSRTQRAQWCEIRGGGGERASEGELGREEWRKGEQALFAQGTLHGPAEWRDDRDVWEG